MRPLFAKGFGTRSASSQNKGKGGLSKLKSKKQKEANLEISEDANDFLNSNPNNNNNSNNEKNNLRLIRQLQDKARRTSIGEAVASAPIPLDDFWSLIPSLIASRFPQATENEFRRVAGFIRHTLNPFLPKADEESDQERSLYRPLDEIHSYMPDLGPTSAFRDPSTLHLCQQLMSNYEIIKDEYQALVQYMTSTATDRFQSVTSMNYDAGWKTLILFYNGHRISGFPYDLCPVTARLLESVPLAGRIAGFNRQNPSSGIPKHSDGNNMWLTIQMGIRVPKNEHNNEVAWIQVGDERRYWKEGECLLYDTTYWHETWNPHPSDERVVLHVDFFNTFSMTATEIQVMQYIYSLREEFMKAEGVAKVGAEIL